MRFPEGQSLQLFIERSSTHFSNIEPNSVFSNELHDRLGVNLLTRKTQNSV